MRTPHFVIEQEDEPPMLLPIHSANDTQFAEEYARKVDEAMRGPWWAPVAYAVTFVLALLGAHYWPLHWWGPQ